MIAGEIESTELDPGGALSGENKLLAAMTYAVLKWVLDEHSPYVDGFINLVNTIRRMKKIGFRKNER